MYGQKEYTHGGDIYRHPDVMDFSVNRNPLGVQPEVLDAIRTNIDRIEAYPDPDCEKLRGAIAAYEGVRADSVMCFHGAAELFFALAAALRPRKALLCSPTFSEYERALHAAGTEVIYYPLFKGDGREPQEEAFALREDFFSYIRQDLDLIIFCNPNNPTGTVTERRLLKRILDRCRLLGIFLVADECFLDFLEQPDAYTMKNYLKEYPNLLLAKSLTKLFAIPGLRLGYAICDNPEVFARLQDVIQPWNVSVPAQIGGAAALSRREEYLKETGRVVAYGRRQLREGLRRLGLTVYGSMANYMFFFSDRTDLYDRALENGFLIRDCRNYRGLEPGYYRIAVRTPEDNQRLLQWMDRELWQKKS